MKPSEQPKLFDPWTSDGAAALEAHAEHDNAFVAGGPLAQYQAAQAVLSDRGACYDRKDGTALLRCVALCLINELKPPQWLVDEFIVRYRLVVEAEVITWDEAFGRPWPKRTRPAVIRRQLRLQRLVHPIVYARVTASPDVFVSRSLFDEIGELPEIAACGSSCEKAYYDAIRDGSPNPAAIRQAKRIDQSQAND